MANWARLQEQLTGLPVVKRAKHSIHFDKGNGEIVANFSGAPCHYQDTDGLWKPIDTKLLLLPDGFYGSPHSDVKIHKDGRVKAGGYQQKSALVAAKEGVVDGDKIVREFKFGTQYLYMKEDGFRQETVITRPPTTAEAKYLIASESGELPSKYKRSDITAVDADGAVHEFVNLGQFKKWLDAAAYPVTIDPDFSVQPDATDGADTHITSWSAYRDFNYGIAINIQTYPTGVDTNRSLIRFDISDIPSGATVSAGTLGLYQTTTQTGKTAKFHRALVQWYEGNKNGAALDAGVDGSTWNYRNNNGSVAWEGGAGGAAGSDWATGATDTETINNGSVTTFDITADCAYWVANPSSNFGGWVLGDSATYLRFASSEFAIESYRPVLTVTYTAGSAGVPKHFLHYARLRSN